MRSAGVYFNEKLAGILLEHNPRLYEFKYDAGFLVHGSAIAFHLPLRAESYISDQLFPFFQNMLIEGLPIPDGMDPADVFGLIASEYDNTVGAVTLKRVL